ncbi:hypothetical protein [Flavobacterium gawalongense]|uniref:Lipoprotein n=1 Tax=Flavobacterium gawalongense TaxID=2594432 RepID=A0A553BL45_9FLAO|nr:hypothetical protein [Flavobacterium gawalongense]TRX00402.1 hypothetical protein FNW33_11880 [Flavobacterium gawalongense]TRX05051.1 hypothetical protein FNW12_12110 [Flavobacterium gawalongense]TRX08969.1 hypothetical protein FNW11_10535 [Flavobacterium gawalongense]TRX10044.1 hypothetical protein FNW10_10265 [Flavobacterium gawalongense]TRX26923.1 hypothetical protein FNW38_10045 [Flavobacterium gawalongense]
MKKQSLYLLICLFTLLVSCSSSENQEETNSYIIKVKEHKTNLPLQGVEISLYYCKYDNEFGCQKRLLSTHITDAKGEYKMTEEEYLKADEGFILRKPQYWNVNRKMEEIAMEPEAWAKIALKTNTTYPTTSIFVLKTTSELGIESIQILKPYKDTIVDFRLFGNEMNKINWIVYKTGQICNGWSGTCSLPTDTITSGSISLNPQKFETLTSSINY